MHALSSAVVADVAALSRRFQQRSPFRHLVIDDFLQTDFATHLLAQFPAFEQGDARNENGELGGKSVVERIRGLGPAFSELDDLVRSRAFLDWLSQVTGIPDLLYDPYYFGGGTHDNRDGQDLDPHVDFNRHPANGWHRRLNLIVYLNPEWSDDWGGSLELHSDPRADNNTITVVTPLFNRCVMFETTASSWHGFSRIRLPTARRLLSRRSVALYFYTRTPPPEELTASHSTIYVDRPLPPQFAAGHTLSTRDVQDLHALLKRRDIHTQRLYEHTARLQARLDGIAALGLGDARSHGALYWLGRGLLALLHATGRERSLPTRETYVQAMTPFVNSLTPAARGQLRRTWRRINAPAFTVATSVGLPATASTARPDDERPIVSPPRGTAPPAAAALPEIAHYQPETMPRPAAHPDGHFYSPVVDTDDIARRQDEIWPTDPQVLGIDFNDASHRTVLEQFFPRHIADYRYPEQAPSEDAALDGYYTQNSQFSWLDSRALFVLMREWQPRRIIEVGSGYSSLLMADVNQRYLDARCEVVCIEPFPRPFLERGIAGLSEVIVLPVQQVPLARFEALQAGDILFIDSSHVAKTGSDVNYLFFEVLPRLAAGVRIHIHDIFLPHDYLKDWVIGENRSWNEQYLLRALLMYSTAFRVLFGCSYAFHRYPEAVKQALNLPSGHAFGGGSLWIERC
jgi:Rps23 Pro-64 3,4-dihydroxylase Tpa1-like proline 4-hydroxylase/predicted O-methyltransferase YrrM